MEITNSKTPASEKNTMRTYTRKEPEIIQGVEDLCRLCLEKREEGVTIFEKSLIPSIATKIMMCVGLEMEEKDCLPNMICTSCEKELESIYSFRKKCEVNYLKLKSHMRAVLKTRKSLQINNNTVPLEKVPEQTEKSKDENKQNSKVVDAQEYIVYLDMNTKNTNYHLEKALNEKHEKHETANNDIIVTSNTILKENKSKDEENEIVNNNNHEILNATSSNDKVENGQGVSIMKHDIVNKDNNDVEEMIVNNEINKNCDEINRSNEEMNQIPVLEPSKTIETSSEPQPAISEVPMETDAVNQDVPDHLTIQFQSNIQVPPLVSIPKPDIQSKAQNTTNTTTTTADTDLPKLLLTQLVKNGLVEMEGQCVSLVYAPGSILQLLTGDGALLTLNLAEEDAEEPEETDSHKLVMATQSAPIKQFNVETPRINNGIQQPTVPRCGLCGRTFVSSSVLKRHMLVHSSVFPHTCNICGKGFKQRAVMTRHLLVHKVERPHKCLACPASFTQRLALVAHMRSHAAPGAKPLQLHRCEACHKTFLHQSGLVRHMKTHLGKIYTCGSCQRTFRDQSSLRRHARQLHRAARPPAAAGDTHLAINPAQ